MVKLVFSISLVLTLAFAASIAWAGGIELSFFLGLKDGSENSEGVVVKFIVEEGAGATDVFEEHWAEQRWSDEFVVDLSQWNGRTITLNLTTDPGPDRNTGWDWILIGDAKITADGDLIFDIGQAVADGTQQLAMLVDGEANETQGLDFGANCSPDGGTVGGETKPKSFMQHPPWDGRVGNTISRYEITLPAVDVAAVEATGKLATTWGQMRTR